MSIKILLADDHKIMRDGLRNLIGKQKDMEVIAEADNGRTTVKLACKLAPDVVIMDIGMPDLNGVDATKQIAKEIPGVKVVALSMHSDRRFVSGMLRAGASGYILKDCAFEELAAAVRTVAANRTYLSPEIAEIVVEDFIHRATQTDSDSIQKLSDREREVAQLLAEGKSTDEIASQLYISVKTVQTHRKNIMEKLGIHSIAELTKFAIREGLTSLD